MPHTCGTSRSSFGKWGAYFLASSRPMSAESGVHGVGLRCLMTLAALCRGLRPQGNSGGAGGVRHLDRDDGVTGVRLPPNSPNCTRHLCAVPRVSAVRVVCQQGPRGPAFPVGDRAFRIVRP